MLNETCWRRLAAYLRRCRHERDCFAQAGCMQERSRPRYGENEVATREQPVRSNRVSPIAAPADQKKKPRPTPAGAVPGAIGKPENEAQRLFSAAAGDPSRESGLRRTICRGRWNSGRRSCRSTAVNGKRCGCEGERPKNTPPRCRGAPTRAAALQGEADRAARGQRAGAEIWPLAMSRAFMA